MRGLHWRDRFFGLRPQARLRFSRALTLEPLEQRALLANLAWHNAALGNDVDADGDIAPVDAIIVINFLNSRDHGPGAVPDDAPVGPPFLDTDADGVVAPSDALSIINYLNSGIQLGQVTPGSVVTVTIKGAHFDPSLATNVTLTDTSSHTFKVTADHAEGNQLTFPVPPYLDPNSGRIGSGIVSLGVEQHIVGGGVTSTVGGRIQILDLPTVNVAAGVVTRAFLDASQSLIDAQVSDYQALASAGSNVGNLSFEVSKLQVVQARLDSLRQTLLPLFNGSTPSLTIGTNVALNANSLSLLDRELAAIFPTSAVAGADYTAKFRQLFDVVASPGGSGYARLQDAVSIGIASGHATHDILVSSPAIIASGGGTAAAANVGFDIALLVSTSGMVAANLRGAVASGDTAAAQQSAFLSSQLLEPSKWEVFDSIFTALADQTQPLAQSAGFLVQGVENADTFFNLLLGNPAITDAQRVADATPTIYSKLAKPTILVTGSADFSFAAGSGSVGNKTLTLKNTGAATLKFGASSSLAGVTVTPLTGQLIAGAQTQLTISVDPTKFAAGTYSGTITVVDPTASNKSMGITFTITAT